MHRHRIHGVHSVAREGSENSHVPVWNAACAMTCKRFQTLTRVVSAMLGHGVDQRIQIRPMVPAAQRVGEDLAYDLVMLLAFYASSLTLDALAMVSAFAGGSEKLRTRHDDGLAGEDRLDGHIAAARIVLTLGKFAHRSARRTIAIADGVVARLF